MIEDRGGTILADSQNEIAFMHAQHQLQQALMFEWERRMEKLADAFGVEQDFDLEMHCTPLPKE